MNTFRLLLASLLLLLPATVGNAQQVCPCVPISHQWIVQPCDTWNCAAAATIMANGDKFVMAIPTNNDDFKWVVIRRIVAGAGYVPPSEPFTIETFDGAATAVARFQAIDQQLTPMMLSMPDGKFTVVSRMTAAGKQRAANH